MKLLKNLKRWRNAEETSVDRPVDTVDTSLRRAALIGAVSIGALLSGRSAEAASTSPVMTQIASGATSARTLAARFADTICVKDFGAFGDGSSHPASSVYGTLAALQAVYGTTCNGVTVALTQELDWLAFNLAVQTLTTSGGTVYFPDGTYVMSNANSASDGSGQTILPSRTYPPLSTGANVVNVRGDGVDTVLLWPSDIGTGKGAILCNCNRTGTTYSQSSIGYIQDISFIGPTAAVIGGANANMMGIRTGDRRAIHNVFIENFWCGIEVLGGQFYWDRVDISACFYGLYWQDNFNQSAGNSNGIQNGNMELHRVIAQLCSKAAIGVNQRSLVVGTDFYSCFFGASPYSFFKETNAGVPAISAGAQYVNFWGCQFENVGNAAFSDDQLAPASVKAIYSVVKWYNCQFGWDTVAGGNFHNADTIYAMIVCFQMFDCEIRGIRNPEQWLPRTDSCIHVTFPGLLILEGDIGQLLANCTAAVGPNVNVFVSGLWEHNNNRLLNRSNGSQPYWDGRINFTTLTSASAGNVVTLDGSENLVNCTGSATELVAGILVYAPASGNYGIVATNGSMPVNSTGTWTAGNGARTTTSGKAQTSATTTALIGFAADNVGTNVNNIILRGLY